MASLKVISGLEHNSAELNSKGANRRKFIGRLGCAAAASLAASATGFSSVAQAAGAQSDSTTTSSSGADTRPQRSFQNRVNAARAELNVPVPPQITNGDEQRYPNRIGNFSKGLLHNNIGEVEPASYHSLLRAVHSGEPEDFEQIQLGGKRRSSIRNADSPSISKALTPTNSPSVLRPRSPASKWPTSRSKATGWLCVAT